MASAWARTSGMVSGPYGPLRGVADVDDVLVGQLVDDRAGDGQSADAGIEDPDRGAS